MEFLTLTSLIVQSHASSLEHPLHRKGTYASTQRADNLLNLLPIVVMCQLSWESLALLLTLTIGLGLGQDSPQRTFVWPYPASSGPWATDPTADPCSLRASEDSGRARLSAMECPSDCGDRTPYRCLATQVQIPWWKVCDGINDCPSSQIPVGTRCGISMNASMDEQQVLCADDELACDSMLDRILDGRIGGVRYDRTSGQLSRYSLDASIPLGSAGRIPVLDRLDHGTGWNFFRMAVEGRYGGAVSCDTVRDTSQCISLLQLHHAAIPTKISRLYDASRVLHFTLILHS